MVLYFNSMTRIAVNEPVSAFDDNGNGRIDFVDVVRLFNRPPNPSNHRGVLAVFPVSAHCTTNTAPLPDGTTAAIHHAAARRSCRGGPRARQPAPIETSGNTPGLPRL
ncbi:MAG: hypothetical protein ABFC38_00940 [Methanospirillum sp.]